MAINFHKKPVNNEDNSFYGQIQKPVSLLSGLAALAAPFTGGATLPLIAGAGGVANTAHEMNKQSQAQAQPAQSQGIAPVETAMGRKFAKVSEDPASKLLEAGRALNSLPPEAQQEYKPILASAYAKHKYGRMG